MIQRIQSVYLFLAALVLSGQFFLPYLQTPEGDPARSLAQLQDGALNPVDNYGMLGLTLLAGVVSVAAIFLFRNRPLQARLAGGGMIACIFLLLLTGFFSKVTMDAVPEGGNVRAGMAWLLPPVSLILLWLAMRSIRKDEQLVRSMDRLR